MAAPAAAPLPDFWIRNLLPASHDGLVKRLAAHDYNQLLQAHPEAVLAYLDDDDGDHITVGSSLELEQRLREPASSLETAPQNAQILHSFMLQRPSAEVRQAWLDLVDRLAQADAQDCIEFGQPTPVGLFKPAGTPQKKASPSSSVAPSNQTNEEAAYENRWASYTHLPGAFSEKLTLPQDEVTPAAATATQPTSRTPLLEIFEAELAKLVSQSPPAPAAAAREFSAAASSPPRSGSPTTAPPPDPPLEDIASAESADRTAAQAFAHGLRNVFNGVSYLTTSYLDAKPELRQYLEQHHGELPQNLHTLLSTGLDTIDSIANLHRPAEEARAPPAADTTPTRARSSRARRRNNTRAQQDDAGSNLPAQAANTTSPARPAHFQVERILARRYINYENSTGPRYKQYLVRWSQHGPEDDVWYDEENLADSCRALINAFEQSHPEDSIADNHASFDEERMLAYESANLHCRTAGDRMVTYRRYPVADSSAATTPTAMPPPLTKRRSAARSMTSDSQASLYGEGRAVKRPSISEQPSGPSFTSGTAPKLATVDERSPKPSSPKSPAMDYSRSEMLARAFTFDPVDVMSRYPPVSQLPSPHLTSEASQSNQAATAAPPAPRDDAPGLRRANTVGFMDPIASDSHLHRANTSASVWERKLEHRRRHGLAEPSSDRVISPFEEALSLFPPRHARTFHHGPRHENPAVRKCVQDLVSLGYKLSVADAVAGMCEGDLQKALDHLDEDRKAWTNRNDLSRPNMPGGWNN